MDLTGSGGGIGGSKKLCTKSVYALSLCTSSYILNNILKYGMNLKFETIVQIFRKIIQLNVVITLKSTNEFY